MFFGRNKFLFILILFVCWSCQPNTLAEINQLITPEDIYTEVADSVIFTYKEQEYIRAVIKAPQLKRYTKKEVGMRFDKGITVYFYEQLQLVSVLTVGYAYNDDVQQTLLLKNKVRIENYKNEVLSADSLVWNMLTKKIYTQGFVHIQTPTDKLSGWGLNADEDFSNYTIKRVTGIVSVNEN